MISTTGIPFCLFFIPSYLTGLLLPSYGFDEVFCNFQQYNFGRGGKEGDAVFASVQDGYKFNNAYFVSPPDGESGVASRIFLWNYTNPYRESDLDAGIVIHELSHGLAPV